jgi:hypothetical protein
MYGNIRFVFLRFEDLCTWDSMLSTIFNVEIKQIVSENITENKSYRYIYKQFKSNFKSKNVQL